jgi:hypothetical protein
MTTVVFSKPDSRSAQEIVRRLVEPSPAAPLLCMVVKVDANDEIVNVEFTDESTVKSLALANALSTERQKPRQKKK